jgi:transcriptional regulator with XRE-family HTH domain
MPDTDQSPLTTWRQEHGMTQRALADVSGVSLREVKEAEAGHTGLAGELQDYLAEQGVNVSTMASEQSRFLAEARASGTDQT